MLTALLPKAHRQFLELTGRLRCSHVGCGAAGLQGSGAVGSGAAEQQGSEAAGLRGSLAPRALLQPLVDHW